MCVSHVIDRGRLMSLPAEHREALGAFATERYLRATEDSARDFWADIWRGSLDPSEYEFVRREINEGLAHVPSEVQTQAMWDQNRREVYARLIGAKAP